jgi:predicted RNA-binding protein with PIN domain
MSLILDAYNILHCAHVLPEPYALLSAPQLGQLLDRIGYHPGPIFVVCDGSPKPEENQSLELGRSRLVYSGPGKTADDVIEEMVSRAVDRRHTTVVSNDRHVQRIARHGGCEAMGVDAFLSGVSAAIHSARAGGSAGPEKPTSANANEWMHHFGLTDKAPRSDRDIEAEAERHLREFGFAPDDDDERP